MSLNITISVQNGATGFSGCYFLCGMKIIIHNQCFTDAKMAVCKLRTSGAKH